MYYYIFEPPTEPRDFERNAQIKEYLSQLGIAGEMISPMPGKTVDDLVQLAVRKRYSTLIAVGGPELVNRVARLLEPYDVVFGIIPTREHPDLSRLIGTTDWKGAAEQLKRRRWQPLRLGLMNGETAFLTPAYLEVPFEGSATLTTSRFSATTGPSLITITPAYGEDATQQLEVHIAPAAPKKKGLLHSLLGRQERPADESTFQAARIDIDVAPSLSVLVAGAEVASTPVRFTMQQEPIRLIVGKNSTISQSEKE